MPNRKKIKFVQIGQKITKVLWIIFLVGFLFPRRFFLMGLEDNVHGQVVAFTSWFFYWVEFLLPLVLIGFLAFFQKANLKHIPKIVWGTLWVMMGLCVVGMVIHEAPHFDALFLFRLMEMWVVSYLVACQLISFRTLLSILLGVLGVQGIIGIGQLIMQNSLGLGMLGEQNLSPDTLGIAKIDIGDMKYIRPVGTLTHANAWGALGILAFGLLPFWNNSMLEENKPASLQKVRRKMEKNTWVTPVAGLLALFFGMCAVLSFSRGSWLGLVMIILLILWQRKMRIKIFAPLMGVLTVVGIWQWDLIWQRVVDWKIAILSRTEMLKYALDLINAEPMGVGVGKFTVMLEQDSTLRMFAPWELQPVHNFFLLAGAELGTIAMLVLIGVGIMLFIKSMRCNALSAVLLLAMLPSLMTDHFFWTDFGMGMLMVVVFTLREIYWSKKSTR